MRVLVIGGGGREHALVWKIRESPQVSEIFIAPGNAGTAGLGTNVAIDVSQNEQVVNFARNRDIDLVVVQQDSCLANGLVDALLAVGIQTFGPTRAMAQIEWSKVFSKEFMQVNNIPTARTFRDLAQASLPVVVKADGLKQGKGVHIAHTLEEAQKAVQELGQEVVLEEFLEGTEVSVHAFCDGTNTRLFPVSRDHKRIGDGNTGPNTGGMGTIAPVEVPTGLLDDVLKRVIMSVVRETGYRGVLFPGLMLTSDGYRVLEYNARFGDPETESYMRLLKTDIVTCMRACIDGTLQETEIRWSKDAAVTVMLCSRGYPGAYTTGHPVSGLDEAESVPGVVVFHAGTKLDDDVVRTNGGRVLGVSAIGSNLAEARERAYRAAEKIQFEGKYYRTDIGI